MKDILPATGKSWRYARIDGRFYYDYDYIPDRKDTRYRSRLGDKETLMLEADELRSTEARIAEQCSRRSIEEYVKERISNTDRLRFRYYEVDGTCKYNKDKAGELAEAIAWARCVKRLVADGGYKEFGYRTKEEFYEACALILHKKRLEGFTVTTGGSLRKKLHYFPADESEQYDFFVSGRYGNDNARKIGKCKVVEDRRNQTVRPPRGADPEAMDEFRRLGEGEQDRPLEPIRARHQLFRRKTAQLFHLLSLYEHV